LPSMNVTAVAPDSSDYQSRGSAEIAPMGKHAKRRSLRPALKVDNTAAKIRCRHTVGDLGHPSGSILRGAKPAGQPKLRAKERRALAFHRIEPKT